MVDYMLSLPGIRDIEMKDRTTAFSMSLGKRNLQMIKSFLFTDHLSDNDPIAMSKRAILDMDAIPEKNDPELKRVLLDGLLHHNVSIENEAPQMGIISEE